MCVTGHSDAQTQYSPSRYERYYSTNAHARNVASDSESDSSVSDTDTAKEAGIDFLFLFLLNHRRPFGNHRVGKATHTTTTARYNRYVKHVFLYCTRPLIVL